MKTNRTWLSAAFLVCFLVVGIPYWLIPYSQVSLPSVLMTPALLLVAISTFVLRVLNLAPFWRVVGVMTATIPAAVLARALFEVALDPTSHNLLPFEVIIASAVGFISAIPGAAAGHLLKRA